jgi:hypothetical protein
MSGVGAEADMAAQANLAFIRRPTISLGAGAAHQHCPLSVAQAVSLNFGGHSELIRILEVAVGATRSVQNRELLPLRLQAVAKLD